MDRQGDEVHIRTTEARGGSTPHVVRYILVISLALLITAFAVIYLTGVASSDAPERQNGPISGQETPAPQ
jgi:hypothetical protein